MRVELTVVGDASELAAGPSLAVYRIAQEALANVQKHARAGSVHVRLRFLADAVRLDVSDDGCGFDSASAVQADASRIGLGLPGMRERASIVGGSVEVSSQPGGGTRVSARIPLQPVGIDLVGAAAS
jgi:signal transduction histidine kinase